MRVDGLSAALLTIAERETQLRCALRVAQRQFHRQTNAQQRRLNETKQFALLLCGLTQWDVGPAATWLSQRNETLVPNRTRASWARCVEDWLLRENVDSLTDPLCDQSYKATRLRAKAVRWLVEYDLFVLG